MIAKCFVLINAKSIQQYVKIFQSNSQIPVVFHVLLGKTETQRCVRITPASLSIFRIQIAEKNRPINYTLGFDRNHSSFP